MERQRPPVTTPQLPNHRVKTKQPLQRVCNETAAGGKLCAGHLKRWYYEADIKERACGDVQRSFGRGAEIYRCEHCKTLYLPAEAGPSGVNVAGVGSVSQFGLTLPPKNKGEQGNAAEAQGAVPKG